MKLRFFQTKRFWVAALVGVLAYWLISLFSLENAFYCAAAIAAACTIGFHRNWILGFGLIAVAVISYLVFGLLIILPNSCSLRDVILLSNTCGSVFMVNISVSYGFGFCGIISLIWGLASHEPKRLEHRSGSTLTMEPATPEHVIARQSLTESDKTVD